MPYDELVKRLRECASGECFNCSQYTETTNASVCSKELMKQVADAIEELSKQHEQQRKNLIALMNEKPRWVPVTERLPERWQNVIVANKRGKHYDIDKAWWNGSFFDRCAKGSYSNVTHWMPLPEPPKEETE